jgi:predicted Fe-S protein YdhL (DUF1289 family)
MSNTSIEKFISQCVAQSPCVGRDTKQCRMNDVGSCVTCKRTLAEISGWETLPFEDREVVCKNLLER